jgi:hypothetical protein
VLSKPTHLNNIALLQQETISLGPYTSFHALPLFEQEDVWNLNSQFLYEKCPHMNFFKRNQTTPHFIEIGVNRFCEEVFEEKKLFLSEYYIVPHDCFTLLI